MAATSWTTVAEESCTTDMITGGGKSGRVAALQGKEESVLTVGLILRRGRPEFPGRRSPGCA